MQKQNRETINVFEQVSLPEFGIEDVSAKIDTGAYTGALHCSIITTEVKGDKKILKFSPLDDTTKTVTKKDFTEKNVKSSNGVSSKRFFVSTDIVISGKKYPIKLSLASRTGMRRPVIIGRKFVRTHKLLIDSYKIKK